MIDLNEVLQEYKSMDLKAIEEKNPGLSDAIRDSIILYNKALENLRTKSEDIAIIELKKAISLNPDFHEAYNLLGICYSCTNNYQKASEYFQRVIESENNSVKALKYMDMLNGKDSTPPSQGNKKRSRLTDKEKNMQARNSSQKEIQASSSKAPQFYENRFKTEILRYTAAVVGGAVIAVLISIPFYNNNKAAVTAANIQDTIQSTAAVEREMEEKYNKLDQEYKKLQKNLEDNKNEIGYYKSVVRLFEVENLVAAKNYEGAADMLVQLGQAGLKDASKDKYDRLREEVLPRAAWSVYTQGNQFFNAKRYNEAIQKLSKVQEYGGNWEYMALTLYQLGICYKETNDMKNALATFTKIKEEYSNTEYAQYAGYRLNEINGQP